MKLLEKIQCAIPVYNVIYLIVSGIKFNRDSKYAQDISNQMITADKAGDKERVLELHTELLGVAKRYTEGDDWFTKAFKALVEESEKNRGPYRDGFEY